MTAAVNEINFAELFKRPEFREMFAQRSGAHGDLGLEIVDATPLLVSMRISFRQQTARAVEGGGVHPGVVMTAMDSAMGLAVMMNLKEPSSLATLELRYDELRAPGPNMDIEVSAICEGFDERIAYLTSAASDVDGVFAKAVGRFVLTGASSDFLQHAMELLSKQLPSDKVAS